MVYSLLNASAVGFDVVRRPAGAQLAGVLVAALTAPPPVLWELAAAHPAAGMNRHEQREWLAAAALMRGVRAATAVGQRPDGDHADPGDSRSCRDASGQLAAFALGRGHHLDRLIATELVLQNQTSGQPGGQTVPADVYRLAADTFAEAAASAWSASVGDPPSVAHALIEQATAADGVPRAIDLGPHTDGLLLILSDGADIVARWRARASTTTTVPDPLVWANAMHQAAWAAELSGRVRCAAAAQLLAAASLTTSGASRGELAAGLWNSVSALVAATVVADLLPATSADILTGRVASPPW